MNDCDDKLSRSKNMFEKRIKVLSETQEQQWYKSENTMKRRSEKKESNKQIMYEKRKKHYNNLKKQTGFKNFSPNRSQNLSLDLSKIEFEDLSPNRSKDTTIELKKVSFAESPYSNGTSEDFSPHSNSTFEDMSPNNSYIRKTNKNSPVKLNRKYESLLQDHLNKLAEYNGRIKEAETIANFIDENLYVLHL